jgi:hypothetical protein
MCRRFQCFDDDVNAGQAIDLNVDQQHRTVRPALALQQALLSKMRSGELEFVYGFPNVKASAVQSRAGYRPLAHVERWFKPIRPHALLEGRISGRFTRRVAAAALAVASRLTSHGFRHCRRSGEQFCQVEEFDARFDELWRRAHTQFAVIGQRDSSYLNWRFNRCPDDHHRICCLTGPDGAFLAYVVYCMDRGVASVADFLFAEPRSLDVLLAEFLRAMRRQRAAGVVVTYAGKSWVSRRLKRFGFLHRPSDWKVMLYGDRDRLGDRFDQLFDAENWFITRADTDTDL